MNKNESRLRRAKSTRSHIRKLGVARLSVHRTGQHIYAQVIDDVKGVTLAAASTIEADVKKGLKNSGNKDAATAVGKLVAERAKKAGVEKVAFDRGSFAYHGRIKALADAAREAGLSF